MQDEPGLPRDPAISEEDAALAVGYEADKRWMDLVKLLAKQAEVVGPDNKAAFHLKVAEIYRDRFANQAEALKAFERVLEHDRGNRAAIGELRALYEKRRDWEKYFELEKGELDRLPAEQQRDRAVELARLAQSRIAKPDVTIYWWQRVLGYEPDHRQALTELEKSFERGERWMELIAVLEQRIELAAGNDEQIETLVKLAMIRDDQLRDLDGALAAWRRLRELDPKHATATAAIERLEAATGDAPPPSTAVKDPPRKADAPKVEVSKAEAFKPETSKTAFKPDIAKAESSKAVERPIEQPRERSPTVTIAIGVVVLALVGIAICLLV